LRKKKPPAKMNTTSEAKGFIIQKVKFRRYK